MALHDRGGVLCWGLRFFLSAKWGGKGDPKNKNRRSESKSMNRTQGQPETPVKIRGCETETMAVINARNSIRTRFRPAIDSACGAALQ